MRYPDQIEITVDGDVADEAALVLAAMNLSVSDAVRLLLDHVAEQRSLPVELCRDTGWHEQMARHEPGFELSSTIHETSAHFVGPERRASAAR